MGAHAQRGKGAAPGQLKAPGSPARGKALGAGKVKVKVKVRRAAPARAQPPPGQIKHKPPKPTTVKHASAKSPRTAAPAAQTAPGQSPTGPPGQARKQDDTATKKP